MTPFVAPRAVRRALLWLLALLALAGCRTEVAVDVEVAENGSGTVTVTAVLDPEAAAAVGGAEGLALDDVRGAGWALEGPEAAEDGSVTVSASRGFADAAGLEAALTEVVGPGVVSDVEVEVEEGFGRTDRSAGYSVTLSGDPAQFGDDDLTGVLGGLPLGRTPEELALEGVAGPGAGVVTISVAVPGGALDTAELDATAGQPQEASVSSESVQYRPLPFVLVGAGLVLVVGALALGVVAAVRRR
jgi:hypothetical protein